MFHRIASALVVGSFLVAATSEAREYYDQFSTPMGLSMGGAVTSYVDDWNSLYYNPAGLAKVEKFSMRLPEIIHAEVSSGAISMFKEVKDLDKTKPVAEQLKDLDGNSASFRVNPLNFAAFFNHIGLALHVADVRTSLRLQVPTFVFARAFYDTRVDSGLTAGYGHSFLNDQLRAGFAMRLLGRVGSSGYLESADIAEIGDSLGDRAGAGIGIDADVGVQGNLTPMSMGRIKVTPMAGAVMQNILASKYDLVRLQTQELKGNPPPNERRINMGVSAKFEGLGPITIIPSFELRDILIDTNSFWEYVSTGVQAGLSGGYWFNGFVRASYYKGSYAAGIGGNLGPGELELGTYAVSLGDGFGVGRDRRYYARLALAW